MIGVYDLYDLHAIFINIRLSPLEKMNKDIMSRIVDTLKNRDSNFEINQFRKAIQPINAIYRNELYSFVSIENKYCYFPLPFLKDERIYTVLIKSCEYLLTALCEENKEKIYDLADSLHNLPIFLAENNYSIPQKYWENEVNFYREKWDKSFLLDVQKLL